MDIQWKMSDGFPWLLVEQVVPSHVRLLQDPVAGPHSNETQPVETVSQAMLGSTKTGKLRQFPWLLVEQVVPSHVRLPQDPVAGPHSNKRPNQLKRFPKPCSGPLKLGNYASAYNGVKKWTRLLCANIT